VNDSSFARRNGFDNDSASLRENESIDNTKLVRATAQAVNRRPLSVDTLGSTPVQSV
jgi:hypothetical protein